MFKGGNCMPEIKTQLSLDVLLNQCAKDENIIKYLNDINHANNEIIHNIFRFQKFNCSAFRHQKRFRNMNFRCSNDTWSNNDITRTTS